MLFAHHVALSREWECACQAWLTCAALPLIQQLFMAPAVCQRCSKHSGHKTITKRELSAPLGAGVRGEALP